MTGAPLFLGIDGGGTKTEFLCIDGAGTTVARHVGSTTYHLQVGIEGVRAVLQQGLDAVERGIGARADTIDHVVIGLPAYGEDSLVDPQLAQMCRDLLGHARFTCVNDMVCGWAGSLGCEDGINLVAGTGSIAYGERRGASARAGGWGEVFSDEGSAYWIAIQGLNAFTRMSDGRLAKGPLHAHFIDALALARELDVCAAVMGPPGMSRDAIAALATTVKAAADAGDMVAAGIFEVAGRELAQLADALRIALGFQDGEPIPLSWSGGVLAENDLVRDVLERELRGFSADYRMVKPRFSPAFGAALYGARLAGHEIAFPDGAVRVGLR